MTSYKVGDKSKAICEDCGKLVTTTLAYRDVPFDDGVGVAEGILADVCDECDSVVALPAQSTPAIVRARKKAEESLEVKLAAWEMEILDSAARRVDPAAGNGKLREALIAHFLRRSATDARFAPIKDNRAEKPNRRIGGASMPEKNLSLRLTPPAGKCLSALMHSSGLSKSQVVRGVISQIEEDLVLPAHPVGMEQFREIAGAPAA